MDKTLSGSAASVDTNTELGGDIPQTFAHLLVVIYGRLDSGVVGGLAQDVYAIVNNDSANNYASGRVENTAPTTAGASEENTSTRGIRLGPLAGPATGTPASGVVLGLIPAYTQTTLRKYGIGFGFARGSLTTGTWTAAVGGGLWNSTNAITRLKFQSNDTTNMTFPAGSRFCLYGLG